MSTPLILALILLCVALEGFFSGTEIAMVSADRLRLRADAQEGHRGAALALEMLARPAYTLGTCLVGTNLSTISAATLAAILVNRELGLPEVAATLFVVPLTLILGEMVPKALYQHHADALVRVVVYPLRLVSLILRPALFLLDQITRLAGGNQEGMSHAGASREEIRLLLESPPAQSLDAADRQLIRRVFDFSEASVEDAMIPLIEVVALPHTATCAEAARRMIETGHSRLPIYRDRIDQIVGVVLHQDLLSVADWQAAVTTVYRPALFVPETKPIDQLLRDMRRERQRMAVAVDEYGGAVGLITVEDILEEIVGEIEDESDRARAQVRRTGQQEWMAEGRAELEHIEAASGLHLPDGDYETVAGYMLSELGRVPRPGERIELADYSITVSRASERAILEVTIRRKA